MSILILIKTFNKNNWIYIYSIFVGSYGIGFINGGFTECLIILLISIKLFLKERNTKGKILYLSLIDLYIVFLKPYLLVFIILFNFTYDLNKKDILKYFFYSFLFLIIFSLIKFSIKIDYLSYYNEGLDLNISKIIKRTFYFLFSPSVGVILTCPFIVLGLLSIKNNKIIKLAIISFYSIFFSFYGDLAFWGGAGIGGSRYIFPIFLIFIEDYVNFLNRLNYRLKQFLIFLFFISFVPSIDYKNTNIALVPEQTGQIIIDSVSNYPLEDFNLNPIYISWKIFIYKDLLNNEKIKIKIKNNNYTLKSLDIMPDTLISKLSYVSNKNFLNSKYFHSHYKNKKNLIDKISNYSLELKFFKFLIFFIYTSLFIYAISRQVKK